MIPYETPILTGDTYEALLEIDPLIDLKWGESGYQYAGILRFSVLVQKAGRVSALKCKEVIDLLERLEGMKPAKSAETVLQKVLEAASD